MSAAKDEREIAERIVGWLQGVHPRGTAGVEISPPCCWACGQLPYHSTQVSGLVTAIEEIISERLHS